jgi:hypothetical protein
MANLINGLCISGKRKYRPKKRGEKETPRPSSIPIDPILLMESISQGKLYSDIASDNICSLSLALSHYLSISRIILLRIHTKIRLTWTMNPKREIRVL